MTGKFNSPQWNMVPGRKRAIYGARIRRTRQTTMASPPGRKTDPAVDALTPELPQKDID